MRITDLKSVLSAVHFYFVGKIQILSVDAFQVTKQQFTHFPGSFVRLWFRACIRIMIMNIHLFRIQRTLGRRSLDFTEKQKKYLFTLKFVPQFNISVIFSCLKFQCFPEKIFQSNIWATNSHKSKLKSCVSHKLRCGTFVSPLRQ